MGIRGLFTYIQRFVDCALEWHQLHDCRIVIDGNNLAYEIYNNGDGLNSSYGGDYEKYALHVLSFFNKLIECNVEPFVIMDGGHPLIRNKFKTLFARMNDTITLCSQVNPDTESVKIFPLHARSVFINSVQSLGITVLQADFEADDEIAVLAKHLGAYVLSNDSDFYLFNVPFILLNSLNFNKVQTEKNKDGTFKFIPSYKFNAATFCSVTQIRQDLLPLLAPLLGNDFLNPSVLSTFHSNNSSLRPRRSTMTMRHKVIVSVIKWLSIQNEEPDVVLDNIIHKLSNFISSEDKVAIKESLRMYFPSESPLKGWLSPHCSSCPLVDDKTDLSNFPSSLDCTKIDFKEPSFVPERVQLDLKCTCPQRLQTTLFRGHNTPSWFIRAFRLSLFPPFVADILNKHFLFSMSQVEVSSQKSVYLKFEAIVRIIRGVLWSTLLRSFQIKGFALEQAPTKKKGKKKKDKQKSKKVTGVSEGFFVNHLSRSMKKKRKRYRKGKTLKSHSPNSSQSKEKKTLAQKAAGEVTLEAEYKKAESSMTPKSFANEDEEEGLSSETASGGEENGDLVEIIENKTSDEDPKENELQVDDEKDSNALEEEDVATTESDSLSENPVKNDVKNKMLVGNEVVEGKTKIEENCSNNVIMNEKKTSHNFKTKEGGRRKRKEAEQKRNDDKRGIRNHIETAKSSEEKLTMDEESQQTDSETDVEETTDENLRGEKEDTGAKMGGKKTKSRMEDGSNVEARDKLLNEDVELPLLKEEHKDSKDVECLLEELLHSGTENGCLLNDKNTQNDSSAAENTEQENQRNLEEELGVEKIKGNVCFKHFFDSNYIPSLKWYIRNANSISAKLFDRENVSKYGKYPTLFEMNELELPEKIKLFFGITELKMKLNDDVPLHIQFIMYCIAYWKINYKKGTETNTTLLCFLMCVLKFCVLDGKLGRKVSNDYIDSLESDLEKVKKLNKSRNFPDTSSISLIDLIESLTVEECRLASVALYRFHDSDLTVTARTFNRKFVHSCSEYQATVFFLQLLNSLLSFPFPYFTIDHFWSGTFCYNMRKVFIPGEHLNSTVFSLFSPNDRIAHLFVKLYNVLQEHLQLPVCKIGKTPKQQGDLGIEAIKKVYLPVPRNIVVDKRGRRYEQDSFDDESPAAEFDVLENPTEEDMMIMAENKFSALLLNS